MYVHGAVFALCCLFHKLPGTNNGLIACLRREPLQLVPIEQKPVAYFGLYALFIVFHRADFVALLILGSTGLQLIADLQKSSRAFLSVQGFWGWGSFKLPTCTISKTQSQHGMCLCGIGHIHALQLPLLHSR